MHFGTLLRTAYNISVYSVFVKMCRFFHNTPVTVNSENGQQTLHTISHAGGKHNIGLQIQTTVQ
jgi:hypothetical protein